MRAATRRRGHRTAAEVIASMDVTVPTAVGDVTRLANQGCCTLPQQLILFYCTVLYCNVSKCGVVT